MKAWGVASEHDLLPVTLLPRKRSEALDKDLPPCFHLYDILSRVRIGDQKLGNREVLPVRVWGLNMLNWLVDLSDLASSKKEAHELLLVAIDDRQSNALKNRPGEFAGVREVLDCDVRKAVMDLERNIKTKKQKNAHVGRDKGTGPFHGVNKSRLNRKKMSVCFRELKIQNGNMNRKSGNVLLARSECTCPLRTEL